jgi:hypothetical protein
MTPSVENEILPLFLNIGFPATVSECSVLKIFYLLGTEIKITS